MLPADQGVEHLPQDDGGHAGDGKRPEAEDARLRRTAPCAIVVCKRTAYDTLYESEREDTTAKITQRHRHG